MENRENLSKDQPKIQEKPDPLWRGRAIKRAGFWLVQEARPSIIRGDCGDAVVEATILFPIMIMIFAALVLLAIYLPTKAALQRATQFAATVIATEISDSWLNYSSSSQSYVWETDKNRLPNVYVALFSGAGDVASKGEDIVADIEERGISSKTGTLSVDCDVFNWLVYKEIVVTATREYTIPVNLSIIGFPETLPITVTSTAVVQNGEEFVRNMDLAVDFVDYISKKFGLTNISESISSGWQKVSSFFGW